MLCNYIFIIRINLTKKKDINKYSEQPGIFFCRKYQFGLVVPKNN